MYTPQTDQNQNTVLTVGHSSSAIQDYTLADNKKVILSLIIIFSLVIVGTAIPLVLIKSVPMIVKIVIPCSFIPSVIILSFIPYVSIARFDKLNHTVTFMKKGLFSYKCSCCYKTFRTYELKEFTMEKFKMGRKNKKFYTIYVNVKNGGPREEAISLPDNSCSFDFSPKLDIMLNELNRILLEDN